MYHVFKVGESDMPVARFLKGKRVGTINPDHATIISDDGWLYFVIAGTEEERFYKAGEVEIATMKQNSDYVSDSEAYSFMERTKTVCEILSIFKEGFGEYPKETDTLLKGLLEDFFTRYGFASCATQIWDEQLEELLRKMRRNANEFIEQEKIDAFLKKLIDMNALVQYRKMTKGKKRRNRMFKGTDEVRHYRNVYQEKLKRLICAVKKTQSNLDESKFTKEFDSENRPIRKYSLSKNSKRFGNYKVEYNGYFNAIITFENCTKKVTGLSFETTLDFILTLKY